jgi:uncharacterized membrane protein YeaQ/YmgE (transglycosylase-associated protein family)
MATIMALFGAHTGTISRITNDILVNQFTKSSPESQTNIECGSFKENELPPVCKTGYSKTFTALTYGSLVKEIFSIIGGLLTTQLSPILGNRILLITSIVITMIGPTTLLWILHDENISPYTYITANSVVGLIKEAIIDTGSGLTQTCISPHPQSGLRTESVD